MSTKKRLLIISAFHVVFFMAFVIFIVFSSMGWLENIQLGLQFTYSLIFPLFMIIMGIATRLLSTKPISLAISAGLAMANMCGTLLMFNVVYPAEEIEQINGMNSSLSIFSDIGPSYVAYAYAYFFVFYFLVWFIKKIINYFKCKKIINKLAATDKKQTKIDNPMYIKSYNKVTNNYEKYLVWISAKGKILSSERIIYFDNVELIAVDSKKTIYAMLEKPQKITIQEYLSLKNEH